MKVQYDVTPSWVSRSTNSKTGDIPTMYAGSSVEQLQRSCVGCALAPAPINPRASERTTKCYAHGGSPKLGFGAMVKAGTNGRSVRDMRGTDAVLPHGRYSLENAMLKRSTWARAVRLGAIGDGARVAKKELRRIVRVVRRARLAVLAYTHFWREYRNRGLKSIFMASCESLSQADDAINAGWIPAAVLPGSSHKNPSDLVRATVRTPDGNTLIVCPAQRAEKVTCNACRLCDPTHKQWRNAKYSGIAFLEH